MPPAGAGGRPEVAVRPAGAGDEAVLRRFLVLAAQWDPSRPSRPDDEVLADDHVARYVEGWGRVGDLGVVAEDAGGRPVGAAWCRRLPPDRPGYGFVAADVPEVSVAVVPERRGRGVGGLLLDALAAASRDRGVRALSLSVEEANPARRLYERVGFVGVGRSGGAVTMLRRLAP